MIDPALARSLVRLAGELGDLRDPWWIIGSTAVALHSVDPDGVDDIDLVVSGRDGALLLDRWGLANDAAPHPQFRSDHYARWSGTDIPVEVQGNFHLNEDGDWKLVTFATREEVLVDGASLFVPSGAELRELMHRFGRDKDLRRAALL
ncbi:hypothetical protein [Sphingomicrobium sediminis]|uniref:Uncharacterized protein n=1 Tax=Sphingomicrobium sediminis TaxID=2950949 RepID=A0A9X2EKT0_9SPHN|nr:hypothetical protein [Sphingomicrobium sediminis]MCM8557174.1 hypothetical protein [Sphingomicrobium sediminis]